MEGVHLNLVCSFHDRVAHPKTATFFLNCIELKNMANFVNKALRRCPYLNITLFCYASDYFHKSPHKRNCRDIIFSSAVRLRGNGVPPVCKMRKYLEGASRLSRAIF